MLLLHLADWHLGRPAGRRERPADHEAALAEQIGLAHERGPDLIVHSGDLFDTFRPPQEVLHQAAWAARELSAVAPTFFISGNHDPVRLFRFLDEFVGDRGEPEGQLRFVTRAGVLPPRTLPSGEELRLGFLPFFHPNRRLEDLAGPEVADAFFDAAGEMASYRDALGVFLGEIGRRMNEGYDPERTVRVLVAHAGLDGARITRNSGERELHVGEMYMTSPARVPPMDYGAFGHVHRPQALPGGGRGRYAGSPMQLDFGEEGEDKSAVLVELSPGVPARTELLPLTGPRRLRRVSVDLDDLEKDARRLAESGRAEILAVTVRTETHQRDLSELVRGAYSGCAEGTEIVSITEDCAEMTGEVLSASGAVGAGESLADLFARYVSGRESLPAPAAAVLEAFTELSSDLGLEEAVPSGALETEEPGPGEAKEPETEEGEVA